MSQPSAGQVHVDGAMKKMSLKDKLAELKTPAKKNRFTAKYHEGLGFRGASGKGATAAEALAHAEQEAK